MPKGALKRSQLSVVTPLANESLYVGVDIGKHSHVAGFVSKTLLQRHERFEGCPVLAFDQSREGFRALVDRIQTYVPLAQAYVMVEKTGHYHKALVQYLQEMDVSVYLIHVQERPKGMMKTDKRDALGLANTLDNQLELGVQVADRTQLVRRAVPPTEAASLLRGLMRHRYELSQEAAQRKNKLIAICDEVFPEFTQICRDPCLPSALAIREQFPTPQALATASITALQAARGYNRKLSDEKLVELQRLASQSIGTKDIGRLRGLVIEQTQIIRELKVLQEHLAQLDVEITQAVEHSREGQILTSIPPIGPIQAATIIASIGHIENFEGAARLKSYFGWAPAVAQSGSTLDSSKLTRAGTRTMKQMLFLIVGNAIQKKDCEWARLYERLVPVKCRWEERTRSYKGKLVVMGRLAGQITEMIYALLKKDAETLRKVPKGQEPPPPLLYDPEVHRAHRQGKYQSMKPKTPSPNIVQLPTHR
jgi:transposase